MSGIVCALRGGQDSRAAITRAVTLAQETSLPVHFLYVINRDYFPDASTRRTQTVVEQMRQMGNSMILTAQAIANSHGVAARGAVRYGNVEEELVGSCHDVGADYLVLNRPNDETDTNTFTPTQLGQLHHRIEQETKAKVVFSRDMGR
jgi:hypothetical protein